MPVVTHEQIIDALRPVEDPELRRSIVDLGMVRDVRIGDDGVVGVLIALTVAGCPLRNEIQNRVGGAVTQVAGVTGFTTGRAAETEGGANWIGLSPAIGGLGTVTGGAITTGGVTAATTTGTASIPLDGARA